MTITNSPHFPSIQQPTHIYLLKEDNVNVEHSFCNRVFKHLKDGFNLYRTSLSYKIEKTTKISYRLIDLAGIINGPLRQSQKFVSSVLKDITLSIESTNFFFVAYPLFIRDQQGRSFFETRTKVQSAETLSLTCHLFLKMFVGAERANLLKLGIIGSYAIGHVAVFRYALEGFILLFNFFGTWDGIRKLSTANKDLSLCERKIAKWDARSHDLAIKKPFSDLSKVFSEEKIACKQHKWKVEHYNKEIDHTKACFKIAAKVSKFVLIVFAVTLMTINVMTNAHLAIILNLGIISDAIGLLGFMFNEYCKESSTFQISKN